LEHPLPPYRETIEKIQHTLFVEKKRDLELSSKIQHLKEKLIPDQISQMAEKNYMLGWRYLSYEMLEEKLEQLLINIYGS